MRRMRDLPGWEAGLLSLLEGPPVNGKEESDTLTIHTPLDLHENTLAEPHSPAPAKSAPTKKAEKVASISNKRGSVPPLNTLNRKTQEPLRERVGKHTRFRSRALTSTFPAAKSTTGRSGIGAASASGMEPERVLPVKHETQELSAWAIAADEEQVEDRREQNDNAQEAIDFNKWKGEEVMMVSDESQRMFASAFGQTKRMMEERFSAPRPPAQPAVVSESVLTDAHRSLESDMAELATDAAELRSALEQEEASQQKHFQKQTQKELLQSRLRAEKAATYTPEVVKPQSLRYGSKLRKNMSSALLRRDDARPSGHGLSSHRRTDSTDAAEQNPLLSRMLFDDERQRDPNRTPSDSDDDSDAYWSAEDEDDFYGVTPAAVTDVSATDVTVWNGNNLSLTPSTSDTYSFAHATAGVRRVLGW